MADQITLRKGDHTVTTTVPIEAVNFEARGYARVTGKTGKASASAQQSDKKSEQK